MFTIDTAQRRSDSVSTRSYNRLTTASNGLLDVDRFFFSCDCCCYLNTLEIDLWKKTQNVREFNNATRNANVHARHAPQFIDNIDIFQLYFSQL